VNTNVSGLIYRAEHMRHFCSRLRATISQTHRYDVYVAASTGCRVCVLTLLDPRGSGLLFFMFIRPQPYTCLGI
jgi:hypothetical protein